MLPRGPATFRVEAAFIFFSSLQALLEDLLIVELHSRVQAALRTQVSFSRAKYLLCHCADLARRSNVRSAVWAFMLLRSGIMSEVNEMTPREDTRKESVLDHGGNLCPLFSMCYI